MDVEVSQIGALFMQEEIQFVVNGRGEEGQEVIGKATFKQPHRRHSRTYNIRRENGNSLFR